MWRPREFFCGFGFLGLEEMETEYAFLWVLETSWNRAVVGKIG